jgi:hypothetical protein
LFDTPEYTCRVFVTNMDGPLDALVWFYNRRAGAYNLNCWLLLFHREESADVAAGDPGDANTAMPKGGTNSIVQ